MPPRSPRPSSLVRIVSLLGRASLDDLPDLARYFVRWSVLALPIGAAAGSACALFLWSLEAVTALRLANPWLLYLLPLVGAFVGWLYHAFGRGAERGSNLIVDAIHEPGAGVPVRIAPLVLIGTLATHLCGGSAGREGTAVQMGGGIASALIRALKFLAPADTRTLLMAGVAGGFGGVFGTPLAGTVFAMEVLAVGRISYTAILPCLISAVVADWSCGAWGVGHTPYHVPMLLDANGATHHLEPWLLSRVILAGILFGLAARLFSELAHLVHDLFKALIRTPYLRPALGGVGVIGLALVFGTDYLGLGLSSPDPSATTIVSSFRAGGAEPWSWLLKIVFTVMTISSGFKGGEVTPLLFVGATLGSALAGPLGAPTELFAALGFVAVFGAAANTPLACTFMAVELFGSGPGANEAYFAVACFVAYFFGGRRGIYLSQRVATPKLAVEGLASDVSPRAARELRDGEDGAAGPRAG